MSFFCYGTTQLPQSPITPELPPRRGHQPCLIRFNVRSLSAQRQQQFICCSPAAGACGIRRRHLRGRPAPLVLPLQQRQPPPPFVLALLHGHAARRPFTICNCNGRMQSRCSHYTARRALCKLKCICADPLHAPKCRESRLQGSTLCSHLDAAAACNCMLLLPASPQAFDAARSCLQMGSSHTVMTRHYEA
jgi:hypothetical protein